MEKKDSSPRSRRRKLTSDVKDSNSNSESCEWKCYLENDCLEHLVNGKAVLLKPSSEKRAILDSIVCTLVPEGYPFSVRDGYLKFQFFDSIQALCSYLRGVLSTQVILEGLGVGQAGEDTTVLAATTQWVVRDGCGMIGGLLFAWVGGNRFDKNVKFWRLFADIAVDVALTLELASPIICHSNSFHFLFDSSFISARECFTGTLILANILRAMCGVAAGATRAVITTHFAKDNNVADVQAKEGSQETLVSLIGMVLGLHLATFTAANGSTVLAIFVFLTSVHIFANYMAVSSLNLRTLNAGRLDAIIQTWKLHGHAGDFSIPAINYQERILPQLWGQRCKQFRYSLGVYLPHTDHCEQHLTRLDRETCMVLRNSLRPKDIELLMTRDAISKDCLIAIFVYALGVKREVATELVDLLNTNGWDTSNLLLKDAKFRYQRIL